MNATKLFRGVLLSLALLFNLNLSAQVTDTGNNVGIGVSTPKHKLSLMWNTEIGFQYAPGSPAQLRIKGASDGMYFTSAYTVTQTAKAFQFYTLNSSNGEVPRITILHNGYMGIGVLQPSAPLSVKGLIRAGEIEVVDVSGWSDFVFKPDYKLMALNDVELFIKANGHLPDVPSEDQVKKDGVNLQKMDAILLQKIEELTLYVMEQKKSIEALQSQVESLTKKEMK